MRTLYTITQKGRKGFLHYTAEEVSSLSLSLTQQGIEHRVEEAK